MLYILHRYIFKVLLNNALNKFIQQQTEGNTIK
jgi:hypothetical protein